MKLELLDMRKTLIRAGRLLALIALTICGTPLSASAQSAPPPQPNGQVRRLTVDEAVRSALENNLGVQIARIDPLIQDLDIAQTRGSWAPTFSTTLQTTSTDTPANSFLSGGATTSDDRFGTNVAIDQTLPWGGSYSLGWDSQRSTTTNLFSNFSPQLRSSLAFNYRQPLLRGFGIDSSRQQRLVSQKNREIADVTLRESMTITTRSVRNSYWDLAYALAVQRQSLDLANQSLRNTRARRDRHHAADRHRRGRSGGRTA